MTLAATLLSLSFLSPLPQSPLKLPPLPAQAGASAPVQRPLSEIERFRRDLLELTGSIAKVENQLVGIGQSYPAIDDLIVEVARSARANEMGLLMLVANRYGMIRGTGRVADELKFQLLTRPLAEATRPVVETMAALMDQNPKQDARQALQDVIKGRITSARRPAAEVMVARASAADLPFALQLSSEPSLDLQLRGVDLLRAIPEPAARERLVALLSKEPAFAAAACDALVLLRDEALPPLQKLLAEPPIDRGFCYAAFAVAQIGAGGGRMLLDEKIAPTLLQRLADREALSRSLAAVALADLAFHSPVGSAVVYRDIDVAEALLDIVDSKVFVPNIDLLRRPAEQRLARMTGRVAAAGEALSWRDWWKGQREGFVGLRVHVGVTDANAAFAVVALRQDRSYVRLLAEGLADLAPLPGVQEILLTRAQMVDLVAMLQQGGFGDAEAMRDTSGLPNTRSLQLQVQGARMQVAMPAGPHAAFDALVANVERTIESELWQLYRHPADEPDRAAFWRAERRWLDANSDPLERGRRLVARVFQNWGVLSPGLRGRALQHLFARTDRRQVFTEADGGRILAILKAAPEFGEGELRLLELAAGVPGDKIWRDCVDFAARVNGGGRSAVRAVFAVIGPDAVLEALQDARPVVRRVAIDEVVAMRDLRAAARLVELIGDSDPEVQRGAVMACGQLPVAVSSRRLIEMVSAEATPAPLRRESLRALGRVGGEQAFAVLERAMGASLQEDKEAALRGLGELRDPRSSHLLAELAVHASGKDIGQLARFYLQRQGGILAVPALRHQLEVVQKPEIRTDLVLLLGGYQDTKVIPELLDLLRLKEHTTDAAELLAGTTGFDVPAQEDRVGATELWWRRNKNLPQWQWLLDGLQAAQVPTVLRAEHFVAGAGTKPVPELARLLVECKEPRLCVLVSAVLRTVTGEDYGAVGLQASLELRQSVAARYRMLGEAMEAAQGR